MWSKSNTALSLQKIPSDDLHGCWLAFQLSVLAWDCKEGRKTWAAHIKQHCHVFSYHVFLNSSFKKSSKWWLSYTNILTMKIKEMCRNFELSHCNRICIWWGSRISSQQTWLQLPPSRVPQLFMCGTPGPREHCKRNCNSSGWQGGTTAPCVWVSALTLPATSVLLLSNKFSAELSLHSRQPHLPPTCFYCFFKTLYWCPHFNIWVALGTRQLF